jgi:hypothetical protein
MDGELPQTMGYEAADVVDELGEGDTDVAALLSGRCGCSRCA